MKLELKLYGKDNDWIEATWYTEADEVKTQVHCEGFSGHPEHITMLRAKVVEYGTPLTAEDELLIAEAISNFVMPEPIIIPIEEIREGMVVTMRQARLALLEQGLLATVDTAIANSDDEALKIEWEYAMDVKRNWTSLVALAHALGMTDEQLDGLFTLASTK